jgi:ABC-type glycerol-3-phosphate transport system permease component/peptidoglycan/LPS O-acetylase OafA/YrhL
VTNLSLATKTPPNKQAARQLESAANRNLGGAWFVAPFFILFLGFGAFGLLFSLFISFHVWDPVQGTGEFLFRGLRPYWLVFTDPPYWAAMLRTLQDGLPGVVLQHLVALPIAFALFLVFRRALGQLGVTFFLPYIASPIALSAALGLLLRLVSSPLEDVFGLLRDLQIVGSILPYRFSSFDNLDAFGLVWNAVGWNVLLYLMALSAIPRSVLEAAQLDGAGFWMQLRKIAFPMARPMVFMAFSMSLVTGLQANAWRASYSDFDTIRLPGYIYGTAFKYANFGLSSTMTWVFFLVMLVFIGVAYWLFGRNFSAIETPASLESDHAPLRLPAVTTLVIQVVTAFGVFFSVYPLLLLFFQATQTYGGNSTELSVGDAASYNYGLLLDRVPEFWRNLWNSIYVSSLASIFAVFSSALAGFAFAALEFKYKRILFGVVLGIIVFPAMSNAIPHLLEMRILDWIDTPRALWLPASVSAIGVFLVRQYSLNALPKTMLEAAKIDGANDLQIFWRIGLPLMTPVLTTVGLLTFVSSWNHLEAAILLMRSEATRLLPQALAFLDRDARDAAVTGAAIALIPPLIVYFIASGQLGAGFGLGTGNRKNWFGFPKNWYARIQPPKAAPAEVQDSSFVLSGADGVRAVACLMVVFSHLAQRLEMPKQETWIQEIQQFLMTGAYGVSAFFVLSGMLLSIPFWRRYLDGLPLPPLKDYARRRFLRIAPGFYVSLIVTFIIARALEPGDFMWLRLFSGLTFTTAFHYVTFFPVELNGPLWSIGFEVFCYALMPMFMIGLFVLAKKIQANANQSTRVVTRDTTRTVLRGKTQIVTRSISKTVIRSKTKNVLEQSVPGSARLAFAYWVGVLILAILAHQWILTHLVPDSVDRSWNNGLIGGAKFWMPNYNPVGLFAQYCIGVLTAGVIAYWQKRLKNLERPIQILALNWVAVGAFAAAIALVWNMRHANEFSFSLGSQPYAFPFFAVLIGTVLAATPFSSWAKTIIDNRFTRYTAKISFGLYIWHYPTLELVRLLHNSDYHYFGISSFGYWAVLTVAVLILAYWVASLSYTHIESPFLKEIRRAKPSKLQTSSLESS